MIETVQLALDLGHRPALGRDDFLVSPGNEQAVAWIDRWPAWPAPGLVIEGPPGAGKTHLAKVWQQRAEADLIDGRALTMALVPDLVAGRPALVVEHADDAPMRALLHLYNAIAERGGHLLLTALAAPARWPIDLADLASRLRALPVATLAPPDDLLLQALLRKLFADRQLGVAADIVAFLAPRMERSYASARALVAAIDQAALAQRRRVTLPLVREVLNGIMPAPE